MLYSQILFQQNSSGVSTLNFLPKTKALLSELCMISSLVLDIISKLDSQKASEGDGIPAIMLKKCAPELTPVLSNYCFSACWKFSSVVSIFKNTGELSAPSNRK